MSFFAFLEEKMLEIVFQCFFLILVLFLLFFYGADYRFILMAAGLFCLSGVGLQWLLYQEKRRKAKEITAFSDHLEEGYYIAEVLPKPKEIQNEAYYYALKKACKAMNDRIGSIEEEKREYREYIESFAHEIKIPIGALSLAFDNTKNYRLKQETDKIFLLVEQMLFYARSENTEKDYFVKPLNLEEVMHHVILKFRYPLIEQKVTVETEHLNHTIYTDEKWLLFILSQIVQNSIKYFDKPEKRLTVCAKEYETHTVLEISDNGCGIKDSDMPRVFGKGFTGSDRKKAGATGMGLYLAKKLCGRLGLGLSIESEEQKYTKVTIVFPKGTVHKFPE